MMMVDDPDAKSEHGGDIDPDLLRESGRASAIQDLADQAKRMADRAVGVEQSMMKAIAAEAKKSRRVALGFAIAIILLAGVSFGTYQTQGSSHDTLESVKKSQESIQKSQEGITELLEFVEEVQTSPPSEETQRLRQAIFEIRELLCADSDPARVEACQALTEAVGDS